MAITANTAKFTKTGETLDHSVASNGTAVAVGTIVKAGGLLCLATSAIAAGTTGALKILHRGEVVTLTANDKIGATDAGVAIYLDSGLLVTKVASDNTLLGYAADAIGANDLSFDVVCA